MLESDYFHDVLIESLDLLGVESVVRFGDFLTGFSMPRGRLRTGAWIWIDGGQGSRNSLKRSGAELQALPEWRE